MRVFWLIVIILLALSAIVLFRAPVAETPAVAIGVPIERRPQTPVRPISIETDTPIAPSESMTPVSFDANGDPILSPDHFEQRARELAGTPLKELIHQPKRSRRSPTPETPELPPPAGAGTTDDPFLISWDHLAAAMQTYRPRADLREIPPQLQALDGQIVHLSGYFLAPWAADEIDELLLIRYMWDGCCIGVPPTAYSAVEVKLAEPLSAGSMFQVRIGMVTGRFQILPHEDGNWLLSLFIMEDAEFMPGP